MIRLPATAILLGRADIKDFESRRKLTAEAARSRRNLGQDVDLCLPSRDVVPMRVRDKSHCGNVDQLAGVKTYEPVQPRKEEDVGMLHRQHSESFLSDDEEQEEDLSSSGSTSRLHSGAPQSPENYQNDSFHLSPPVKSTFDYGGFAKTSRHERADEKSHLTPQTNRSSLRLPFTEPQRLRHPIARSPLFISHNASTSPQQPGTSSMTPQLASRVASHSTPSILLSQPARRVPRSARVFRHQTNSFSFDSSERASAVYEQERVTSYSTTGSSKRLTTELNLCEELNGKTSLSSSGGNSDDSALVIDASPFPANNVLANDITSPSITSRQSLISSSPQLPLPPPFSAASRRSSGLDILPAKSRSVAQHPQTSPPQAHTPSPQRISPWSKPRVFSTPATFIANLPTELSVIGKSPFNFFERAARVISTYRVRTPTHDNILERSAPSSSPRTKLMGVSDLRTPSAAYRVYNDSLPASTQPQTPTQMPESRHQSRYHPSFTVPANRIESQQDRHDTRGFPHSSMRRQLSFATPSRRRDGRTNSPLGLRARGFEGLYGGRENGDEEENWYEGVRFNNVGVRLWGLRDARNDGRSMRDTPEPEQWGTARGET